MNHRSNTSGGRIIGLASKDQKNRKNEEDVDDDEGEGGGGGAKKKVLQYIFIET